MQNQFVDLYRNGVKTAADAATYSLEKAVELQERQLGILRTIVDENKRSAESFADAKSFEDLLALQSRFARTQLERTAEIWSNFVQAAAEQQKAWIERMQSQVGQTKERVRDTYDLTSRTSEEIARTAANQVSRATGSIREAASAAQPEKHRRSA
jgi:phasin family protein